MTIEELRAKWMKDATTCPDTPAGQAASTAIRLCARELSRLLPDAPEVGSARSARVYCGHCAAEAAFIINGTAVCFEHRSRELRK